MALLEVENLSVEFITDRGVVKAVDRLSFEIDKGEVLGIVGESGSGKSVSSLALMGLLPKPPARITAGQVLYEGKNLLSLSESQMRGLRGREISMIFQDPFTSLNPYLKISTQLMEVIQTHSNMSASDAKRRCLVVLEQLGVPDPGSRFNAYPHQLSGGLKQRMMIAMSLLLKPKLIIADEPTTALDVTIQAQILELLKGVNEREGTAIILISHDLGVVSGLCDRVQVMYGGRLAEKGTVDEVFYETKHPYTRGLLESIPSITAPTGSRLKPIPGSPPDLTKLGDYCAFSERCSLVQDRCRSSRPLIETVSGSNRHEFECFFPLKTEGARHLAS